MFDNFINLNETINTLGPKQNGQHFAYDIFKYMILNKTVFIEISSTLAPESTVDKRSGFSDTFPSWLYSTIDDVVHREEP